MYSYSTFNKGARVPESSLWDRRVTLITKDLPKELPDLPGLLSSAHFKNLSGLMVRKNHQNLTKFCPKPE